jgi:hypothetical protein
MSNPSQFDLSQYLKPGIEMQWLEDYYESLNKHITAVREAGKKIGVSLLQQEMHDLSKYTVQEFPHYARSFHGDKADPDGFAGAWLHHIHHNPHHWQYWIFPDRFVPKGSKVENGVVEMPPPYALEMIADWMGASYAYTGSWDMQKWLFKNIPRIILHSDTAEYVRQTLDALGYADTVNGREFAKAAHSESEES